MTATEYPVNQTEHDFQLGQLVTPAAPARPAGAAFTATELSIIGHLLGRREAPESVASALGLDVEVAAELCQGLHSRSMLGMREMAGKNLYYVC